MGLMHTMGPDKAVVITGGKSPKGKRVKVGGWTYSFPRINHSKYLSLTLMTLIPRCRQVETSEGVPLNVSGVAQCKVINNREFILIAAEQFFGKKRYEIEWSILQTVEGHLRAILGTLTVEEIYKDREKFAGLVREVATPDLAKMGIQIVSFVIKDIEDDVGYLKSLGKKRTAEVKRDAAIGIALATRDAGIREAECEKEASDVKYDTMAKIEDNSRLYQLQKAGFDKEVNTAKAEAALAYELEEARLRQQIRFEEIGIDIVERKKQIEIQAKEIDRIERELMATVKLSAEAEKYCLETIAEGMKYSKIENTIGECESIKLIGKSEAGRRELVSVWEAAKMGMKAKALQAYGDAGIFHLVLEKMPEIAASISSPLVKTQEIVMLGGGKGGSENNLISNISILAGMIPPAISALNNIDLVQIIKKINEKDH